MSAIAFSCRTPGVTASRGLFLFFILVLLFGSASTLSAAVPVPTITSIDPTSGQQGQTMSVALTGTNFVTGVTQASFGPGIAVGGAPEGSIGPVTVSNATSATAQIAISSTFAPGPRKVFVQNDPQQAPSFPVLFLVNSAQGPQIPLQIIGINPSSVSVGTLVTVSGTGFVPSSGVVPQITLSKQGGGSLSMPLSSVTNTTLTFVVPAGASTGPIAVAVAGRTATSSTALTILPSSNFAVAAAPTTAMLIEGQSASVVVTLTSTSGFSSLAQLSVAGVPPGVTATFTPTKITAGQSAKLTLTAPAAQALGSSVLTITASATVDGMPLSQSSAVQLSVQPPSTSLVGQTVLTDAFETPLAGVTATMLGTDGNGNTTGCTGTTRSDAAGNFQLLNLGANCVGPQLVGFDGLTASSPPGKYAGVNLVFTLTSGQVTASPVPVHLPQIDNLETFSVQQDAATDQTYAYASVPGLSLTVYAHTTFTMPDGTQPNPFPLVAANVPVDRLPDAKPNVPTMMRVFIVAFQPANVDASQPVAVSYPNMINTSPGSNMAFMTLDPTRGQMVPYGTGTVSVDGTQVIPDSDPAHPGHGFGIVHFDWHGPMPVPPVQPNPPPPPIPPTSTCNVCPCPASVDLDIFPQAGDPVDLFSGAQTITNADISIRGSRGSIGVTRIQRSLTAVSGAFGVGANHNYNYAVDSIFVPSVPTVINLILPDGNRVPFTRQSSGIYSNSTVPALRGVVMTGIGNDTELRWKDGTVFHFSAISVPVGALLSSIRDPNGNTTTISRDPTVRVNSVTDPVGRSLIFAYDSSNRIISIRDNFGRLVQYTYNAQGTLATVTDPANGVTRYDYNSQNNMIRLTDARTIVRAQDTLDPNGHVIQQQRPDGGVLTFSYTPVNATSASTQMLRGQVTDSLGVQRSYRLNVNGFVTDVADTNGQTRHIERAPSTNLLSSVTEVFATTAYTYDANGNVLSATDPTGRKTVFTYEPTFNKVTSKTDPAGNVTRFAYDSRGNLISQTDPSGNTTSYQYSSTGLRTQMTDALEQTTNYTYDNFGNLTAIADSLGNKTTYAYDGISRLTQTTDPLSRTTSLSYDAMGRLTSRQDARGAVTQFTYDANGNLLTVTDANNNKTIFTYDAFNRLATRTDALGQSDTRTYDTSGNLIRFMDRKGQVSSFTYDNLNQLVTETYPDATVTRSYDALGRLVRVDDSAAGAFMYSYDAAGRLLSSVTPFGAISYTYDPRGAMASRQVVGQAALTFTYDFAGNVILAALPQASDSFTYNKRNQVATIARQNGVTTTYTYDQVGRLFAMSHSTGSTVIDAEEYAYDPDGNRISHATGSGQPLITQPTVSQFDLNNRLTQFGSTALTYDANGNLVQDGTAAYTWDSRNRLKSIVTSAGQTTTFTYDFAGQLISQSDSGSSLNLTKYFVLDELTNIAYEAASDGTSYSVLSGRSIDSHFGIVRSDGQIEYGLSDAINSTVATVDQTGAVISQFSYEPFGQTTTTGTYPFQYTGRVPVSSGLYYYRARFYNSQFGRFISEDPIALAGGVNLYAYARGNPIKFNDPRGTDATRQNPGFDNCVVAYYSACLDKGEPFQQCVDDANSYCAHIYPPLTTPDPNEPGLQEPLFDPVMSVCKVGVIILLQ